MGDPPQTKTESMVADQLALDPEGRIEKLAGYCWPHYRQALEAAEAVRDLAAVGSSLAACLHGATNLPAQKLDLFYALGRLPALANLLEDLGAKPEGAEEIPNGQRRVTLKFKDIAITARGLPSRFSFAGDTEFMAVGAHTVRVLKAPALLAESETSGWPSERPYLDSLRAAIRLSSTGGRGAPRELDPTHWFMQQVRDDPGLRADLEALGTPQSEPLDDDEWWPAS